MVRSRMGIHQLSSFSVTLTDTQELATYVIRTFQLQRVSSMNVSIPFYTPHLHNFSALLKNDLMNLLSLKEIYAEVTL
jgi:hypothetical protein